MEDRKRESQRMHTGAETTKKAREHTRDKDKDKDKEKEKEKEKEKDKQKPRGSKNEKLKQSKELRLPSSPMKMDSGGEEDIAAEDERFLLMLFQTVPPSTYVPNSQWHPL
jgi:hypothetical protein